MRRFVSLLLCGFTVLSFRATGQSTSIKPMHVPAGTVLTFYLQTRLNPANGNAIDLLPKGTTLKIKVLDSIDSDLTHDGAEFRGTVVTPVLSHEEVLIHADADVRGLFALLRSRNHPEGFRYELLITGITDGGKLFQLTASMNPSFQDTALQVVAKTGHETSGTEKPVEPGSAHK